MPCRPAAVVVNERISAARGSIIRVFAVIENSSFRKVPRRRNSLRGHVRGLTARHRLLSDT